MKKSFEFELSITDKDFSLTYQNEVANHLAALVIARDNFNYICENLKKSLEQAPGKQKNVYRDRLGKFSSALWATELVLKSTINEYKPFYDKEVSQESSAGSVPHGDGNTEPADLEEGSKKEA